MALNKMTRSSPLVPLEIDPLPSSSLPIPTFTSSRNLAKGGQTDLLIQEYDDRVFVLLTQLGKIGSLTQATLSPLLALPTPRRPPGPPEDPDSLTSLLPLLPPPHSSTILLPLLGTPRDPSDQTRDELYISQIATLVWWLLENPSRPASASRSKGKGGRKPVVVSLALGKDDRPRDETSEDEDGDDNARERERFAGVMGMIAEWSS